MCSQGFADQCVSDTDVCFLSLSPLKQSSRESVPSGTSVGIAGPLLLVSSLSLLRSVVTARSFLMIVPFCVRAASLQLTNFFAHFHLLPHSTQRCFMVSVMELSAEPMVLDLFVGLGRVAARSLLSSLSGHRRNSTRTSEC